MTLISAQSQTTTLRHFSALLRPVALATPLRWFSSSRRRILRPFVFLLCLTQTFAWNTAIGFNFRCTLTLAMRTTRL